MSNDLVVHAGTLSPPRPGLSQAERVADVFLAPSKTFNDILRSTSWWLPFLLMLLFSLATTFVADRQVGFDRITETQVHNSPRQEDALNQLSPEQRAARMAVTVRITRYISYAVPLLLVVGFAFYALILWGCFNFILGAQTTFPQVFATCFYAALPYLLLNVLTLVTLYFGGNPEAYDYKNPVGTNIGYYMTDSAPWLRALLGRVDLIQLWTLGLTILGMSIIARKTLTQSALVVGGWWLIVTIFSVVGASFS